MGWRRIGRMQIGNCHFASTISIRPGNPGNFCGCFDCWTPVFQCHLGPSADQRSLVYLGNLLSSLAVCVTHPSAAGELFFFFVSDGEDISNRILFSGSQKLWDALKTMVPFHQCYANGWTNSEELMKSIV